MRNFLEVAAVFIFILSISITVVCVFSFFGLKIIPFKNIALYSFEIALAIYTLCVIDKFVIKNI